MEVRFAGLPDREPWTSVDWEADPDWEFRTAARLEPEQLHSRYRQACERSRRVVSSAAGLDQLSVRALRDGRHFALRWVLLHLIEETARHVGPLNEAVPEIKIGKGTRCSTIELHRPRPMIGFEPISAALQAKYPPPAHQARLRVSVAMRKSPCVARSRSPLVAS